MKLKHYGVALVPFCLAAFLFRAMELILAIDPKTGYFETGAWIPYVFDGFLVATAIFFATVLFRKREPKPAAVRLYRASLFDAVVGIAGAVLLVAAALFRLFSGISDGSVTVDGSLFLSAVFWRGIFAVLAAVFLIFFVTYPKKSAKNNGWRIMSLALTAYYLFLLLVNFQDLDVVFSRSYGIYLITFYGIAAAASINFSKILARLFGRKAFVLFTCLMAVMASVRVADAVLWLIPGNPYGVPMDLFGFLADVCLTVLLLSQMKKLMLKRRRRRPEPVEDEPSARGVSSVDSE